MRPGCAPPRSISVPVGTVLHAESASATAPWSVLFVVRLAMTSIGSPNVLPPLCETFTQIWLGPKKSWYASRTVAVFVVPPGGMYAAPHWRSTPNGEQLVPHTFEPRTMLAAFVPYIHVLPSSIDFQTSACRGPADSLPAR